MDIERDERESRGSRLESGAPPASLDGLLFRC
jgi:hypothetical protein